MVAEPAALLGPCRFGPHSARHDLVEEHCRVVAADAAQDDCLIAALPDEVRLRKLETSAVDAGEHDDVGRNDERSQRVPTPIEGNAICDDPRLAVLEGVLQ